MAKGACPWRRARSVGLKPKGARRRFTRLSSALASAACCLATTPATLLSRCRCAAARRGPHAPQAPRTRQLQTLTCRGAQFIERSFPSVDSSNALKEAIVSITTLGASFGAFFGGFFSDYYGRCATARSCLAKLAHQPTPADAPRRRSAIMASDLVFGMAALKMGVAMTPRQLIEGRAIMVRALRVH